MKLGYLQKEELKACHGWLLHQVFHGYGCFTWVVGNEWRAHFERHLEHARTSSMYAAWSLGDTLIRPACCSFSLNKDMRLSSERLKAR